MHLIWLAAVVPGMLFFVAAFPKTRVPRRWLFTAAIALSGLIVWNALRFYVGEIPSEEFGWRTLVYALLTSIDLPMLAFVVGAGINWLLSVFWKPNVGPESETQSLGTMEVA